MARIHIGDVFETTTGRGLLYVQLTHDHDELSPVGHAPVPAERAAFPMFKTGVRDHRTGEVAQWWLWDGEREWRVDELDAEQRELPERGIFNHAALLWEVLGDPGEEPDGGPSPEPSAVHYLYFGDEAAARRAAKDAGGEAAPSAGDETSWLVQVRGGANTDAIDALEARLVAVAERHGGEYDGHEVGIR